VEIQEKMTCINAMMSCKISGVAYLCRRSRHTEDAIALVSRERGEVSRYDLAMILDFD
jgi:myo-inositol-hexaphosphate 3-phosphohydrolase